MKVDATLSNMTSCNFSGTRAHKQLSSPPWVCRPTPDSGSSDLVLRLEPCDLCLLIAPVLQNTGTRSLKSCSLRISNVRAPSLTSHSDQLRQTQSLPSLCLQLHLASPTLTSSDQASHHHPLHPPDQVTGLRHTRLLHARRILRKKQINLPCI